eukprot:278782-Chlamydomonas_euryale.AAC.4
MKLHVQQGGTVSMSSILAGCAGRRNTKVCFELLCCHTVEVEVVSRSAHDLEMYFAHLADPAARPSTPV